MDPKRPTIQENATIIKRSTPPPADPGFKADPMESFRVGQRIIHNRFGPGIIKGITGEHPECRATIVFDRFGEKTILFKYAKMKAE